MPPGAKKLDVQPTDKENEFATLLKLQKGLFVKLYCIANQPLLVDPANEGNVVQDTFKQTTSNGNGAYLEILPNSRYTVSITETDEYNLQTNIQVADWIDDGSIDEYKPAENKGEITITLPDGFKDKVTNIAGSNVRTFTVSAVGGGITIKSNSNAAVATANLNQSNRTVTVMSKKAGTTVITVANASDLSKTVTYSFSVTGIDYNGAAVNRITNYYVAPVTAGNLTYDELSPRLNNICPSGWHVPARDELFDMIGESSGSVWLGTTVAITAVINAFGGISCWSSTQGGCYLINGNTIMVTGGRASTECYSVRYIRHK